MTRGRRPPVAGEAAVSRVGRPIVDHGADRATVTVEASIAGADHTIGFRAPPGSVAAGGDALLAGCLLPAMRVGAPLEIAEPVSPRLLLGAETIQEVYHLWDRRLRKIEIRAAAGPAPAPPRGVACFFTAGVDSFYTVLRHQREIAALIFVYGLDVDLDDHALRARVGDAVRAAARELGKPLVEVETDLCAMSNRYVRWRFYNGAALACVGHLLAPRFHRVLIPASHTYAQLFPWGTHPLVDPLWSGDAVEVVHDGAGLTRPEKVARIATSEIALRWLRVCFENRDGAYNCGRCEKCLRTMVALRAVGVLERCRTFDRPLDLDAVAALPLHGMSEQSFAEDNLWFVEAETRDPALADALRASLRHARPEGPVRVARGGGRGDAA